MDKLDFEYIRNLVKANSGVTLSEDKMYLVESRMISILRSKKLDSIHELVLQINSNHDSSLVDAVVDEMTTNETFFFRDIKPFDLLKSQIIPEVIEARKVSRKINIWCSACSSGQEPFSIAMLIHENFPELLNWNVNILATDISSQMLEKAKSGYFNKFEMSRGLPGNLMKYFHQHEKGWQVNEDIRNYIKFSQNNLVGNWISLIGQVDIIFMRNVLIYFESQTKNQVLKKVEKVIKPDGFLFLGQSETVSGLNSSFETCHFHSASCFQLKSHLKSKKLLY